MAPLHRFDGRFRLRSIKNLPVQPFAVAFVKWPMTGFGADTKIRPSI